MRKSYNKSVIENLGKEYLETLISKSGCISDVLRGYNLCPSGSCSRTVLRKLAKVWGVEIKFSQSNISKSRKSYTKYAYEVNDIFCANSDVARYIVKRTAIANNILDNTVCSICGIKNNWNNKSLVFILDHINGINNDNRLDNLRLICPNCNSQLETTGSRNLKNKKILLPDTDKKYYCSSCGTEKSKVGKLCVKCTNISKRKVVNRPEKAILLEEVKLLGFVKTGKKYGVSDKAVRNWLR